MVEIIFKTYEGEYVLEQRHITNSIIDILISNRIPFNSVVIYGERGNNVERVIGLHEKIISLSEKYDKLIVQPDRNITYSSLLLKVLIIEKNAESVSEYSYTKTDKIIH